MALQDNNLMLLDLSDGFPRTIDNANDTLKVGVDTTFAADLAVGGNLSVTGDIISGGTMDVVVTDNFIDLSNGTGTGANKAGGLTVNVQSSLARVSLTNAVFQSQASAAGAFATLSIPGFDPSTGGVGGVPLADGDIIEIAGCADLAGNNGLFVIEAITAGAGGLIEIKNAAQTQTPFGQTNFEDGTETAAAASFAGAVDLGVFCISDGALLDIGGNPIPVGQFVSAFQAAAKLSNLVYEAAANVSLQEAYNVGQQILLSDGTGAGNLTIRTDDTGARADFLLQNEAGTQAYLATSNGLVTLGDGATIKTAMSGQVSTDITFDGVGARTISQAGQDLTMSVSGAANLSMVASGGQANIDSADDSRFAMAANDAGNKQVTIAASNAGGGQALVVVQADDAVGLNAAAIQGTGGQTIDWNAQGAAAGALTLQAPNGGVAMTGGTGVGVTAVANALNLTAQAGGVVATANDADLDLVANGVGKVDIDGASGVTVDAAAGGIQLLATGAASSFTSAGQDLNILTQGGGNLALDSAGNVSSTAQTNWSAAAVGGNLGLEAQAGAAEMSASTTLDLIATNGAATLESTNAAVSVDAGTSMALSTGSGNIQMQAFLGLQGVAQNGSVLFRSQAAAQDATLEAQQGIAALLGQSASVTSTNGDVQVIQGGAGSKMILSAAGTAATDAIALAAGAGGISIEATTQARLASLSGSIVVEATAAGQSINIDANDSSRFQLQGLNAMLTLESQQGAVMLRSAALSAGGAVLVEGHLGISDQEAGAGYTATATAAINAGQVVMSTVGQADEVNVADRTSSGVPVGIAMAAAAPAAGCPIHSLHGYPVKTQTAAVAGDVGKFLYLDAAGAMTTTAPTASGDYVWRLGCIVNLAGGNAVILWAPQFIAKRP